MGGAMIMAMHVGFRISSKIAAGILASILALVGAYASAAGTSKLDKALDQIDALGTSTYSVTGDVNNNCTLTTSTNNICVGSYIWTDDHSNDASTNKGALIQNGYVQQNLVSNINIDSTVSPVSASANIVSNVTPATGSTVNLSNSASSTGFIGGY